MRFWVRFYEAMRIWVAQAMHRKCVTYNVFIIQIIKKKIIFKPFIIE